ncbi:type I-E CRISPR-associated protein Cse2/CasB [Actinokineospora sp. NPDC004072]
MNDTDEARRRFTAHLFGLHRGLSSENPQRVSEARRSLAMLRRSTAGPRNQVAAYETVFAHEPPEAEQEAWLLLAGLFALHPQPRRAPRKPMSLGASLATLAKERDNSAAVTRRFTALLSRDASTLPHHLRQVIRLLSAHDVAVDYDKLLDDLVVLTNGGRPDAAHRVRLQWAREYHRTASKNPTSTESPDKDAPENP